MGKEDSSALVIEETEEPPGTLVVLELVPECRVEDYPGRDPENEAWD